jgi:hypothetical protein
MENIQCDRDERMPKKEHVKINISNLISWTSDFSFVIIEISLLKISSNHMKFLNGISLVYYLPEQQNQCIQHKA